MTVAPFDPAVDLRTPCDLCRYPAVKTVRLICGHTLNRCRWHGIRLRHLCPTCGDPAQAAGRKYPMNIEPNRYGT